MSTTVDQFCQTLAEFAPLHLAETWDNVGLLIGNRSGLVTRVMTCLTLTPAVAQEAVAEKVQLIAVHHPLPFRPLQRITSDSVAGKILLDLMRANIAVYSAHTAYDSAAKGINQQIAEHLAMTDILPLTLENQSSSKNVSTENTPLLGPGRYGALQQPMPLVDLVSASAQVARGSSPRYVGGPDWSIRKVAIACGSGGSFLDLAVRKGCNALITGEATFHNCLEAESQGIGLVLLGHYHSERFAMETLAQSLATLHPTTTCWASRNEKDPIRTVA